MSISGLGTDIIEIRRIEKVFKRHHRRFLERLLTKKEQAYCLSYRNPLPHLAGRFAAKEAVFKALGSGVSSGLEWTDVEILNDSQGKPLVYLSERLMKKYPAASILISITHCREYAAATAIYLE